jgi:hypothetical protein
MKQLPQSEQIIEASYLAACSPEKAFEWLSEIALERTDTFFDSGHEVLEYILYRRKNKLIDLGLAKYASNQFVLRRVFDKGNGGVRCAVLSSRHLIDRQEWGTRHLIIDIEKIVEHGNRRELNALAANPYLGDGYYEHMIDRTGYFKGLTDLQYKRMLYQLGDNPRISTARDETVLDGFADFEYRNVFTAAWGLCKKVPATQEWASILQNLLKNAQPPTGMSNLREVLERWRIDELDEDGEISVFSSYSFYLRSRLADLLHADDQLVNSDDLAARQSFYRRFSPYKYEDWPAFLEKDGEDFVESAMDNMELWRDKEERKKLHDIVWDCPDPNSSMNMPNSYRAREEGLKERFPNWFLEGDED